MCVHYTILSVQYESNYHTNKPNHVPVALSVYETHVKNTIRYVYATHINTAHAHVLVSIDLFIFHLFIVHDHGILYHYSRTRKCVWYAII